MADGDIILTLQFDDGSVPDPEPPFELGTCGAELYEAVAPLAYDDELHGWPLARLCEALGRMRQPISDLVRAWEEREVPVERGDPVTLLRSGWSRAAHPSRAPGAGEEIDMLPFVGQLVGVRGIEGLSDRDRRDAIRQRDGFSRGQPGAILSAAQRFIDGSGGVTLRERYDPRLGDEVDAPYRGRVVLKRSRIKDLVRTNLVHNPRAAAGGAAGVSSGVGVTDVAHTQVPCSWHPGIDRCYRVVGRSAAGSGVRSLVFTPETAAAVVARRKYTVSAFVKITGAWTSVVGTEGIRWYVVWHDASSAIVGTELGPSILPPHPVDDTRLATTFRAPAGAVRGTFQLRQDTAAAGEELSYELTGLLLEEGPALREFGDGATPGWRSVGTANASPSTSPGITPAEISQRLLARIPAGLTFDVVITDDLDYDELQSPAPGVTRTYAEVRASFADYTDLLED